MSKPKLTVYYYPKCGTCRKALKWLQENGYELDLHDLFEQSPDKDTVAEWVSLSGLPVKKFFNTSGEVYKELKLKDKLPTLSDEEQIELLASNGRLVKRPVVTDGKTATVGFKEEEFSRVWPGAKV
ncbi:arsenate reductase family protein [Paenibacillus daejeonensis]|uniref:arsenate reductase family protein n=1 Tax=Paenibacillus daejeonensis TaxID=135193 RepID=UPI00035E3894|nr:arsenate reductase family protein [Paenibacillus daejeonensis]